MSDNFDSNYEHFIDICTKLGSRENALPSFLLGTSLDFLLRRNFFSAKGGGVGASDQLSGSPLVVPLAAPNLGL